MATSARAKTARAMARANPANREVALERLYEGRPPPCPIGCGGRSEVVRVSTADDGSGQVWVECRNCAQRMRYGVPAADEAERSGVAEAVEAGREPTCPRHTMRVQLRRRGRQLVCPGCGVRFRQ